jgi:hypothetical protein
VREWRRTEGRDIAGLGSQGNENVGAAGVEEDAETIAAYFELHGFSSTTGLIASEMEHVRTFYVFFPAPSPCLEARGLEGGCRQIEKLTMRPLFIRVRPPPL